MSFDRNKIIYVPGNLQKSVERKINVTDRPKISCCLGGDILDICKARKYFHTAAPFDRVHVYNLFHVNSNFITGRDHCFLLQTLLCLTDCSMRFEVGT